MCCRSLRGRWKTTDNPDSGYDTTAASILAQKKGQPRDKNMSASIKTLLKKKIAGMGDQGTKSTTPKKKDGRKKKIKQATKTKEQTLKHTNFNNLIERRPRRRKDRIPIVIRKTLRDIEILST